MKIFKIGGLVLPLFLSLQSMASSESEAVDHAIRAGVKQFGIENAVNDYIKKQVPEKYIKLAEQISPALQILSTGRITLKWEI